MRPKTIGKWGRLECPFFPSHFFSVFTSEKTVKFGGTHKRKSYENFFFQNKNIRWINTTLLKTIYSSYITWKNMKNFSGFQFQKYVHLSISSHFCFFFKPLLLKPPNHFKISRLFPPLIGNFTPQNWGRLHTWQSRGAGFKSIFLLASTKLPKSWHDPFREVNGAKNNKWPLG